MDKHACSKVQSIAGRVHQQLSGSLLKHLDTLQYRYLGLFKSEVEAATAYDRELIVRKGVDAATNFDLSEYSDLLGN